MPSYKLDIILDSVTSAGVISGRVTVTTHADVTCRRIVLKWACREGNTFRELPGARLRMAKRVDWHAGQTYDYPFAFQPRHDHNCHLHVRPEVYLIGRSKPDRFFDWQTVDATTTETEQAGQPSAPSAASEEPSVQPFSIDLYFDQRDQHYDFAQPITGTIIIWSDRDYDVKKLALYYNWRKKDPAALEESSPVGVFVAGPESWQAGQRYSYPFFFSVIDGPATYHGHNQRVDWNVWPDADISPQSGGQPASVLTPLEEEQPAGEELAGSSEIARAFRMAKTEIFLPAVFQGQFLSPRLQSVEVRNPSNELLKWSVVVGIVVIGTIVLSQLLDASDLPFLIVFAIFALLSVLFRAAAKYKYRWVERKLGPVEVVFQLSPYRRALHGTVHFRTRKAIFINFVAALLQVTEETTQRVYWGSWEDGAPTNVVVIYKKQQDTEIFRLIPADETVQTTFEIPLPSPPRPNEKKGPSWKTTEIFWQVVVEIDVDGLWNWKRTFPLTVR